MAVYVSATGPAHATANSETGGRRVHRKHCQTATSPLAFAVERPIAKPVPGLVVAHERGTRPPGE